jgi:hypothetical protein
MPIRGWIAYCLPLFTRLIPTAILGASLLARAPVVESQVAAEITEALGWLDGSVRQLGLFRHEEREEVPLQPALRPGRAISRTTDIPT